MTIHRSTCILSFFAVQFTENLQVIFDQEGWTLDTTMTLKSNLYVFSYEEVFKAVSNKYTSKCYLLDNTCLAGGCYGPFPKKVKTHNTR